MQCFYCQTHKDAETDFRRTSGNKPQCKACYSKYISDYLKSRPEKTAKNREYAKKSSPKLKKLRRDFIWNLKRRPCMDCGQRFHPTVMEFDHLPGSVKTNAVSAMAVKKSKLTAIVSEIEKCDLVCANCHRIRTAKRSYGEDRYYAEIPFQ